eukprot:5193332-Amphidinium_carterae.1
MVAHLHLSVGNGSHQVPTINCLSVSDADSRFPAQTPCSCDSTSLADFTALTNGKTGQLGQHGGSMTLCKSSLSTSGMWGRGEGACCGMK